MMKMEIIAPLALSGEIVVRTEGAMDNVFWILWDARGNGRKLGKIYGFTQAIMVVWMKMDIFTLSTGRRMLFGEEVRTFHLMKLNV